MSCGAYLNFVLRVRKLSMKKNVGTCTSIRKGNDVDSPLSL